MANQSFAVSISWAILSIHSISEAIKVNEKVMTTLLYDCNRVKGMNARSIHCGRITSKTSIS